MGYLKLRHRVWWIRYWRDGKRYEESSGSEKESGARALLRRREGDIQRGEAVTPKVGRIRFDEAADDVINDYRTNRKRSLDDVERRIQKHLVPFFGDRRLSSITTADIRKYIAQRQAATSVVRKAFTFTMRNGTVRHVPATQRTVAGVSNAEINRELTALKRMFTLAIQSGRLLQKPHIPMLKEHNVRVGFFERTSSRPCCDGCQSRLGPLRCSRTSPGGGSTAKCCRSSGGRSTSRPARSVSIPAPPRMAKAASFR
jgi:hypothetical protein